MKYSFCINFKQFPILTKPELLESLRPMNIKYIVFGMMAVLLLLFIGAKFFIPHEKNKGQKEAFFAESVKAFKSTPTKDNYEACLNTAKELAFLKNKSEEEVKKFLSSQGIIFS